MKYQTEEQVRKAARALVPRDRQAQWATENKINPNTLSSYLSGYLPRCPPRLQQIMGLKRTTVYGRVDN